MNRKITTAKLTTVRFATAMCTAIAATALLGAATANAESPRSLDAMMDTCIQKFLASNLPDYDGKITVQKEEFGHRPAFAGERGLKFSVSAVGRSSGTSFGSVTCEMSRDGELISIKTVSAPKKVLRGESAVVAKNIVE